MFFHLNSRRTGAPHALVAGAFALAALPLWATGTGTPLSLDVATQLAAERAPQVQAQLLRTDAARDDAVRAGRLPDPRLTVGLSNLTATGGQAFNVAADAMTMRTVGLSQAIPSFARRSAEKAVAKTNAQLDESAVARLRQGVKQAAATAWIALWAAHVVRDELDALRAQSSLAVKLAGARLKGATGDATDVLAARSAEAELANRIDAANAEIASARAALRRWVGNAADSALAGAPDFSVLPIPAAVLQQRLDQQAPLLGWGAREAQAQASLALARAGKHPDWSVSAIYGDRIRRSAMLGIEVGVTLPLFAGNRQDRDIGARAAEYDAVKAEHEDARRAQREVVAAALATWRGSARQVKNYRITLLPLAADRSRTALAAYRGGGALQPWLDARRDEIDTRVGYAQALAALGTTWAQLAYLIPDHDTPTARSVLEQLP